MTEIEVYVQQIFEQMNISNILADLAETPRIIEETVMNLQNQASCRICVCAYRLCTIRSAKQRNAIVLNHI